MVNEQIEIRFLNIYNFLIFLEDWKDNHNTSKDTSFLELYNYIRANKNSCTVITMTTSLEEDGIDIYTDRGSNFCFTAYSKNSDFAKFYSNKLKEAKKLIFQLNEKE